MSYQIGIDTIRLTPASRLAHTEYCDHEPFMGLDHRHHPTAPQPRREV